MSPSFFHCSLISVPQNTPACVLFPGAAVWERLPNTFGYVRSTHRIEHSWRSSIGDAPESPPWRDYPNEVLTDREHIRFPQGSGHQLVISGRNCCNEFASACRISGHWHGRNGDPDIPKSWPVFCSSAVGSNLLTLQRAEDEGGDIVTGLPLVMRGGNPVDRKFVIANASDVAHAFAVHPGGIFGPPPPAWQELCDLWVEGKDTGIDDDRLAADMETLARKHNAGISDRLLYSIVAQRKDGSLMLVGVHGAVHRIAQWLVRKWDVDQALVLDVSGSVGWSYRGPADTSERLLLAGPNQRPAGTVFLAFDVGEFLQSMEYPDFQVGDSIDADLT